MDEVRNSINDIKAKADVHCEHLHSWNPPLYKGGFEFLKFSKKERVLNFPIHREWLVKSVVLEQAGLSLTN